MKDVTPMFKPSGVCGCGCGREGTYRVRPWRSNGVTCVNRGCSCNQCTGYRSKKGGGRGQRDGKKQLDIKAASSLRTGHEENDDTAWENKAGVSFTGPAFTAWEKAEAQYENNRPVGRERLQLLRMTHPKRSYALVEMRLERNETLRQWWERLGVRKGWL